MQKHSVLDVWSGSEYAYAAYKELVLRWLTFSLQKQNKLQVSLYRTADFSFCC